MTLLKISALSALTGLVVSLAVSSSSCSKREPEKSGRSASDLAASPEVAGSTLPGPRRITECAGPPEAETTDKVRFAVIGDYGNAGPQEAAVAKLVKSWSPSFIMTTGDNNYPSGARETIDRNIGQYFQEFICPYQGGYGPGANVNRFFPSLGNHDWYAAGARPYIEYFKLPGNERYYDVSWGAVQLFMLDSDPQEPDGVSANSVQAAWLKQRLAASSARWKLVAMHHPPYSSGPHASTPYMQWPYKEWGASLVLAGHDHDYERILVQGLPYVVVGLGGASLYPLSAGVPGSAFRYNQGYGAALIEATQEKLDLRFENVRGELLDELHLPLK
ncbi:MAG: metallophosphoesterase [Myxococcota bacterium]